MSPLRDHAHVPRLERIYSWWGSHPAAYRAACQVVFLGRERAIRGRAVERLGLSAGDSVLDLACGTGVNFDLLQQRIGTSGRLIGLDASAEMLGAARERVERFGWRNVDLREGDAARAELDGNTLDGALCTLGLSVIPDYEAAVAAVERALKPGARFVVLDAQPFSGAARPLNVLVKPGFEWTTGWRWERDLPAALDAAFGSADVAQLHSGSLFIASATKVPGGQLGPDPSST